MKTNPLLLALSHAIKSGKDNIEDEMRRINLTDNAMLITQDKKKRINALLKMIVKETTNG